MNKIILYSTDCPACKIVKQRLNQEGYDYETISDMSDIMSVAKNHNILSVPFVMYGDTIYLKDDIENLFDRIKSEKGA